MSLRSEESSGSLESIAADSTSHSAKFMAYFYSRFAAGTSARVGGAARESQNITARTEPRPPLRYRIVGDPAGASAERAPGGLEFREAGLPVLLSLTVLGDDSSRGILDEGLAGKLAGDFSDLGFDLADFPLEALPLG